MEKTICLKTISDVKQFVDIVSKCTYDIELVNEKYVIDAKSILGIFSLDLSKPIKMVIHSNECNELLEELSNFIC